MPSNFLYHMLLNLSLLIKVINHVAFNYLSRIVSEDVFLNLVN